mmetsp:Transcript_28438/g.65517  ORF Transcript_28438/g.65517 Transcript_28438/m.65517 type:complete len:269 (-) Transcript_28438:265-1071(-)
MTAVTAVTGLAHANDAVRRLEKPQDAAVKAVHCEVRQYPSQVGDDVGHCGRVNKADKQGDAVIPDDHVAGRGIFRLGDELLRGRLLNVGVRSLEFLNGCNGELCNLARFNPVLGAEFQNKRLHSAIPLSGQREGLLRRQSQLCLVQQAHGGAVPFDQRVPQHGTAPHKGPDGRLAGRPSLLEVCQVALLLPRLFSGLALSECLETQVGDVVVHNGLGLLGSQEVNVRVHSELVADQVLHLANQQRFLLQVAKCSPAQLAQNRLAWLRG